MQFDSIGGWPYSEPVPAVHNRYGSGGTAERYDEAGHDAHQQKEQER